MATLYYSGFNGYQQFPLKENNFPKVITEWSSIQHNDVINVSCSHKIFCIETENYFEIFGLLESNKQNYNVIRKPTKIDNFKTSDEFLIANVGMCLCMLKFEDLTWVEVNLQFSNEEQEHDWKKQNNIVKYSFREDCSDILLLLTNGSVWKLSDGGKITLFFHCDVDRVIDISSGLEHTLLLTEYGCVLSFGNGSRGQLGNGDLNSTEEPAQVAVLGGLNIIKIEAGAWHSCAITDSGDLYTWGWNNYGQLSAFDDDGEVGLTTSPMLVDVAGEFETKVVDVACGLRHTVALLENGDVYVCGWNSYRQLGLDLDCEKVSKFTKSFTLGQNGKIFCGPWYTMLLEKKAQSNEEEVITMS